MNRLRLLFLLAAGLVLPVHGQDAPASGDAPPAQLLKASEDGKLDQVKMLVEQQNVPVDGTSGPLAATALLDAADGGHLDVLQYLISKHASLDLADNEGSTPLLHACWTDHADCALALIAAGANVNLGSKAGRTPLMYAAMHGDDAIVKGLIAGKVQLDANCSEGPAVLWAAGNDHASTVMLLSDAGAKLDLGPDGGNPKKYSVLAMAAANNNVKLIDYLLQHGMDINLTGGDGGTPLMAAVRYSRSEATQHLLAGGAKTDLQDQEGNTALMLAPNAALAMLLLPSHPNLELKNKEGNTALLYAAAHHSLEEVIALTQAGADINATDAHGETALTIAGDVGLQTIVDFLREKGAKRTDVHIIAKELPAEALPPAQAWALAVGVIYTQRDGLNPQELGGGIPSVAGEKIMLKRDWGITDKASLLHELDDLRDRGHHTAYREAGEKLVAAPGGALTPQQSETPEQAFRSNAVKASYVKWKDRTGVAWDLCRSAMLVNSGYAVGYMEYQEAWDRLQAIAVQTQSTFTSWQEMSDNFLDGREIWAGKRDPRFEACAQLLLNPKDPNSPWNQNPWNTVLSKPGHLANNPSAPQ